MGIFFAAVVVEFVGLVVVGVFDQQLDGSGACLRGLDGIAQDLGRKAAAVDRDQLHARADAGFGGELAFDGVGDGAIVVQVEADREGGGNEVVRAAELLIISDGVSS